MPHGITIHVPDAHSFSDSDMDSDNHYSSDWFRIYEFKVRICPRSRTHDWTECPFAHPGEKARRRDPRIYHYSGSPCPDFKTGRCDRGNACEYAHGVFECWLHPTRYRTQPCKDGAMCRRRVCFFAHTQRQLRVVSPKGRGGLTSPTSILRSESLFEDEAMIAVMMGRMGLSYDATERVDCESVDDDAGFGEFDLGWISELVK